MLRTVRRRAPVGHHERMTARPALRRRPSSYGYAAGFSAFAPQPARRIRAREVDARRRRSPSAWRASRPACARTPSRTLPHAGPSRQSRSGRRRSSSPCCRRCPGRRWVKLVAMANTDTARADAPRRTTTPRSVGAAGRARPRRSASSMTKTGAQPGSTSGTRQPARSAHSGRGSWRPDVFERRRPPGDQPVRQQTRSWRTPGTAPATLTATPSQVAAPATTGFSSTLRLMMQQRVAHDVHERGQAEHGDRRDQGGAHQRAIDGPRAGLRPAAVVGLASKWSTRPQRGMTAYRGVGPRLRGADAARRRGTRPDRDPAVSRG